VAAEEDTFVRWWFVGSIGAFLVSRLPFLPPVIAAPLALPAVFLFPAMPLLAVFGFRPSTVRDLLLAPALSPVVLGAAGTGVLFAGGDVGVWTALLVAAGALVRILEPDPPVPEPDAPDRRTWLLALGAVALVALVLLPSEYRREASDAYFHTAVVHDIARGGLPPEDPYFAFLPLQYFWFFHVVLLALDAGLRVTPPTSMALLNGLAAGLCVVLAARLARGLGASRAGGAWAGALLLFGMGSLFWLFLPLKLLRTLTGDVQGTDELGEIFRLAPFDIVTVARFTSVFHSTSFLLRKFLVGTAVSWALVLVLVTFDAAVRLLRREGGRQGALLVLAGAGCFLFHAVLGGAWVGALGAGGALAAARLRSRRPLLVTLTAGLAGILGAPLFLAVTRTMESDNLLPVTIAPLAMASLPVTLAAVLILGWPALRAWARRRDEATLTFLLATAVLAVYALFARLPGPNQFDKPPILVFVPLAVVAGAGTGMLLARWTNGGKRGLLVVLLVLVTLPVNALRLASFVAESRGPERTAAEERVLAWLGSATPRDAVVIDSADRVDVLVYAPRRQYWGIEAYADQWGYDAGEMDRRRALRDRLYTGPCPSPEDLRPLRDLPAPVYVVLREGDAPGRAACFDAHPLLAREFEQPGIRVYRVLPGAS
jgi:hypothetical protein